VFRFCCCTCGAELDDRWSLSHQCARCEYLEGRKITDELFRKLLAEIADAGLTITVQGGPPANQSESAGK
jgi:hypothetical protein